MRTSTSPAARAIARLAAYVCFASTVLAATTATTATTAIVGGCASAAPSAVADSSTEASDGGVEVSSARPVAAATEIVTVRNERGSVEGTLEVPEAPGPVPLVIIVSGSGMQDRDGNRPDGTGPNMYKLLTASLREAGIASLRYDDPGGGKSRTALPPTNEQITYEMEVDIVRRWVDAMQPDPRFGAIVIAGHSQGSLSAILVAQERAVAVVSLAGAGRPIGRLLHEQLAPKLTTTQLAMLDDALAKLERGELAGPQEPPLDEILHESIQPYFISWMKYDPSVEMAKVHGRGLVVQGETDIQVTVGDAKLLAAAKPDASLVLIKDMCHPLKQATSKTSLGQTKQYEDPGLPLHEALVPAVVNFVRGLPASK